MVYYLNRSVHGILIAAAHNDGYSINIKWAQAYPTVRTNKIGYNIYMSNDIVSPMTSTFFNTSPSFVSFDGSKNADIIDLVPGELYHFAVRAFEYNSNVFDVSTLPTFPNGLGFYPQSLLRSDIGISDTIIPVIDVEFFPPTGTVKMGAELINYSSVDLANNNLVLTNAGIQRGYNDSEISIHNTDGYDGYVYWDANVLFWPIVSEDSNTKIYECWNRFDIDHYPFTIVDGYRQTTKDILTTDLSFSDAINANFPSYDYAGYHRTDPVLLLNGTCIGSYIGGTMYCADGYDGVGRQLRGVSIDDQNTARQEVLLSTDGIAVVLVRRQTLGITCRCMLPYNEYPEARCPVCFGSGKVVGYNQFFNFPKRSDGRIMVRFDPTVDDLAATDSGLESINAPNCWTLVYPTLKDRDFIVRYDLNGNEEFRYEILNVSRNLLFLGISGAQKFSVQRIRKTDPLCQIPIFSDTSNFPTIVNTSIESSLGLPPHSHEWVRNEKFPFGTKQLLGSAAGHNHIIFLNKNTGLLEISVELGHTHSLIF